MPVTKDVVVLESAALQPPLRNVPALAANATGAPEVMDAVAFTELYDEYVGFVHRGARRLGVGDAAVEDVVQEVFLTAYRRFSSFRRESSLRTWLFGITIRVVRLHRRTTVRANLNGVIDRSASAETEHVADRRTTQPDDAVEAKDAWRRLMRLLDGLDEEKREIFVLAELEELAVPEIAEALDIKLNTAYSRLRLARAAFENALTAMKVSP